MACAHDSARALGIPVVEFVTCAATAALSTRASASSRSKVSFPSPDFQIPRTRLCIQWLACYVPLWCPKQKRLAVGRSQGLPLKCELTISPHFLSLTTWRAGNPHVPKCDWVLLNTFYELEIGAVDALRAHHGINSCPIGPLVLNSGADQELVMCTSGSALWIEDAAALRSLDEQPPASVIYVSFGSSVFMSLQQVEEPAHGLEISGHRFMRAMRLDDHALEKGEDVSKQFVAFFAEFVERTRDRSLVVQWVPQAEMLAHSATAASLSHCGWNSTLESVGVLILAWPQFTDNKTKSSYIGKVWEVGLTLECPPNRWACVAVRCCKESKDDDGNSSSR